MGTKCINVHISIRSLFIWVVVVVVLITSHWNSFCILVLLFCCGSLYSLKKLNFHFRHRTSKDYSQRSRTESLRCVYAIFPLNIVNASCPLPTRLFHVSLQLTPTKRCMNNLFLYSFTKLCRLDNSFIVCPSGNPSIFITVRYKSICTLLLCTVLEQNLKVLQVILFSLLQRNA